MKIIYCKYCKQPFETDGSFKRAGQIAAHMRTCKSNPKRLENIAAQKRGSRTMNRKNAEHKHNLAILNEQSRKDRRLKCQNCGNEFIVSMTDRDYQKHQDMIDGYCHRYCKHCSHAIGGFAKSHNDSHKVKRPFLANKPNKKYKEYHFCQCLVCKRVFLQISKSKCCSLQCKLEYKNHKVQYLSNETRKKLSEAGKKSAANQFVQKRSKCEIEFCLLCEQHFNIVEHNKPIFNGWDADILLHEIKVAIQWNGPWHYKQISKKTSLASIQNRDKIKRHEVEKAGWSLYVIKDQESHKKALKRLQFVNDHFLRFLKFLNEHKNVQFYEEFELL